MIDLKHNPDQSNVFVPTTNPVCVHFDVFSVLCKVKVFLIGFVCKLLSPISLGVRGGQLDATNWPLLLVATPVPLGEICPPTIEAGVISEIR